MHDIAEDLRRLTELLSAGDRRLMTDRDRSKLGLAQAILVLKRWEAGVYAAGGVIRQEVLAGPCRD